MGFISSLFEIHHRVVGKEAMEHCTNTSISNQELQIIEKYKLNRETYVPIRNSLLVMIFNLFYLMGKQQTESNPESTFDISHNFFQGQLFEFYEALPEHYKPSMQGFYNCITNYIHIEESAQWLFNEASESDFSSLEQEKQEGFVIFTNSYITKASKFFEKNTQKLLK